MTHTNSESRLLQSERFAAKLSLGSAVSRVGSQPMDVHQSMELSPSGSGALWPFFFEAIEFVGLTIDAAGVLAILGGLLVASFRFALHHQREVDGYRRFRQDLGRGILLGLEFLVAADIVRTVALTPTLDGVLILGLIVLIRTFLSIALQVELEGKWPWQSAISSADGKR